MKQTKKKLKKKAAFIDSYIGFHHELNKFDQLLAPDENELERRKRIQQSRNKRNQKRQDKIKKLINEIPESVK